jgi:hypothetical protein
MFKKMPLSLVSAQWKPEEDRLCNARSRAPVNKSRRVEIAAVHAEGESMAIA